MDIAYLKEFVAVAKNANVTKTARMLNVSQPVLSRHIAVVEKEVGCQLFSREGNGFSLTPHGAVFLEDAQRLLIEYEHSAHKMRRLRNKQATKLDVCTHVSCKPTDDLIKRCRQSLKASNPLMTIAVRNAGPASPLSDVANGLVDVALVSGNGTEFGGVDAEFLFEEPLWAVVRRDHRLAARRQIEPKDLAGEMVWCSHEAPVARHYLGIQGMLEHLDVEADFVELPFNDSADALVLDFDRGVYLDGAGVIAHSLSLLSLASDYLALPLAGDIKLQHCALYRKGCDNPATAEFLQELKAVLSHTDMSLYWRNNPML